MLEQTDVLTSYTRLLAVGGLSTEPQLVHGAAVICLRVDVAKRVVPGLKELERDGALRDVKRVVDDSRRQGVLQNDARRHGLVSELRSRRKVL
tara:strand:+ start:288 stop:566 length:279 start_codon:yes stop_codon:yes gene_type:complete